MLTIPACPLVRLRPNKPQCSRHSIGKPGQAAESGRELELENKAWWPLLGTKLSLQFASHREFLPKQPTYNFYLFIYLFFVVGCGGTGVAQRPAGSRFIGTAKKRYGIYFLA
jgi:hypothetical protein